MFCAFGISVSDILGYESGQSRQKGHRYDRQEDEQLFGDADTCRLRKTQRVDDCGNDQKGDANQKVLQGNRSADRKDLFDNARRAEAVFGDGEWQGVLFEIQERKYNARCLRNHGGKCRTRRVHVENGDKQEIEYNIDHARNGYKQERTFGVSDASENTAEGVVSRDKNHAGAADSDIGDCLRKGFGRGLQHLCQGAGQGDQEDGQYDGNDGEQTNHAAHDVSCGLEIFGSDCMSDQDGNAHRQTRNDGGDGNHQLAAGCDGGNACGTAELTDDDQIDRAVQCLQQKRQHQRDGKADQRG